MKGKGFDGNYCRGCAELSVVSYEAGHYQSVRLLSHYHGCDVAALIFWQRKRWLIEEEEKNVDTAVSGKKIDVHVIDGVR